MLELTLHHYCVWNHLSRFTGCFVMFFFMYLNTPWWIFKQSIMGSICLGLNSILEKEIWKLILRNWWIPKVHLKKIPKQLFFTTESNPKVYPKMPKTTLQKSFNSQSSHKNLKRTLQKWVNAQTSSKNPQSDSSYISWHSRKDTWNESTPKVHPKVPKMILQKWIDS